jgi:hypothetical protein
MASFSRSINRDVVDPLKRLRLGRIAATLPERLMFADKHEMPLDDLLLLIFTNEIARRDNAADTRATEAGLEPAMWLELRDKTAKVSFDKKVMSERVSLRFLELHRHV